MIRNSIPRTWLPALLLIFLPGLGSQPAHAQPPAVFSALEAEPPAGGATQAAPADPAGPTVLRQRLGALDLAVLHTARVASTVASLSLNLFPDTVFPARVTRVEATRSGGYALSGQLDGRPLSTFTLVVNGDTVAGSVLTPGDHYEISSPPDTPGVTAIRQMDPASLPDGCDTPGPPHAEPPAPAAGPVEAAKASSDDPTIMDVAVFYTPAARKSWGGTAQAETTIDLWVAQTNQAYVDSAVNQRIRLVHRQEIAYTSSGKNGVDLARLKGTQDGHMDAVHTIRTQVGADLIHLITAGVGDGSGMAQVLGPWSVSKYGGGSITFAHELGHNMGLLHDWPPGQTQPNATPPHASDRFSCNYGYVNQKAFEDGAPVSARWYTIMALNTQCGRSGGFNCTPLMRFSNPDQSYLGDPLGQTCQPPPRGAPEPANARESLNIIAGTVAGWQAAVEAPLFLTQIPNPAQTYPVSTAMPPFRLPAASAGTGALTYTLTPALPAGLSFDAATRTISGTPTTASAETTYTYTATDTDDPPNTASLTFRLTIVASVSDLCTASDPAVGNGGSALVTDCYTLLGLKGVLRGGGGSTSLNWDRTRAMTAWDGLTVSGSPARVTGLALPGRQLAGSLSQALSSLTGLTTLNLSNNQLTGSIPALSSLTGLTSLNLSDNQLTGAIPALSSLTGLTTLDLSNNQLTGTIPALSSLSGLTSLNLRDNRLTGRIPLQVGQPPLTTLTTFYATTNDTLCLPQELLAWHGTTLTKRDFLISCLSTLTPPYALTFIRDVPISRLTLALSGNTARTWPDETDNLPAGLYLDHTTDGTAIEMWGTPTELQTAAASSFRIQGQGKDYPQVSLVLTTTVEADTAPDLTGKSVEAQTYTQGSAVTVTLPASTTGNAPLTYSLSPALPAGLSFDASTRSLSGTPTASATEKTYTYTATDANGDTAALSFSLAVAARSTSGTGNTGGGGGGGSGGGGGGAADPAVLHGFFESPADGAVVSGIDLIRGWTFAEARRVTIERVDLYLDGRRAAVIPCCSTRDDVRERFPTLPRATTSRSGWGIIQNWGNLAAGEHTVQVVVRSSDGGRWASERHTITVLKPGDIAYATRFSLAEADARLTGGQLVLTGVVIADATTEQELEARYAWQTGAQGLRLVSSRTLQTARSRPVGLARLLAGVWHWLSPRRVTANPGIERFYEAPADHARVAGIGLMRGWAFPVEATDTVATVTVEIDGGAKRESAPCCSTRPDIAAAYPDQPNALLSGWGAVTNYGNLREGEHTLAVRIATEAGLEATEEHTVTVSRLGGSAFVDRFDLSGAEVEVVGEEIILSGVEVRDSATQETQTIEVRLRWSRATQGLVIVGTEVMP